MIDLNLIVPALIIPASLFYAYKEDRTTLQFIVSVLGLFTGAAFFQAWVCNTYLTPYEGLFCHFKSINLAIILMVVYLRYIALRIVKKVDELTIF